MADKHIKVEQDTPVGSSSIVNTEPEGAIASQNSHKHRFIVEFAPDDKYTIKCVQPRTVLEAIKGLKAYEKNIKDKDKEIIIKMGTGDDESIIATHFPCSCLRDDEVLTLISTSKVKNPVDTEEVLPKDNYCVFYVDTKGGENLTSKSLFRIKKMENYKYVCVYGKKGMILEEALKKDGRFIEDLGDFDLMNNNNGIKTECKDRIDNVENEKVKVCRQRQTKKAKENANFHTDPEQQKQQKIPQANNSQTTSETELGLALVKQEGVSVKAALSKADSSADRDEIYERLREQFPGLKEWMERRYPGNLYQETVKLRKENFGKIQQSFSEVHRVEKLLELGKSVCKVTVKDVCVGTGFVLFDNFILTNAHLFRGYVEEKELQQDVEVFAIFNYEKPEPETNAFYFRAKNTFTDFDDELDYAVLELNPEGSKLNQKTNANDIKVPAGLLSRFGPLPPSGEACIIGHPAGGVKQMDPTWIIEAEKRGQAIDEYLGQFKEPVIIQRISDYIIKQDIEDILIGGRKAGKVGTYHTFMYHGASGSPVFDGLGRVFGLHTGGYVYGFTKDTESVIERSHSLIIIFENFVSNLKASGNEELLKKVEKAARGNFHLKKKFHLEEAEEAMDAS